MDKPQTQGMKFVDWDPATHTLRCEGDWDLRHMSAIQAAFSSLPSGKNKMIIDGQNIQHLDAAGAWFLLKKVKKLSAKTQVQWKNFSAPHQQLLTIIEKEISTQKPLPIVKPSKGLNKIGRITVSSFLGLYSYLSFVGKLTYEWLRVLPHLKHWRGREVISVINRSGFQALFIIALLSFMIGVVISYQMGNQLRNYGANVFIVDLLGLSILREFGPLLTSIMVAGRTGSAYAAQLGIMKINQEIDALDTMGVTPGELLLLPRIVGLVIVLPLLTMWADIFGVLGGMCMAYNMLGVNWYDFLTRFQHEIPLKTLIIGLGKAPVFALLIASIGCFQGMQVQGSADSVGVRTTRSVVLAIFFIIVTDAIFSVILSRYQL